MRRDGMGSAVMAARAIAERMPAPVAITLAGLGAFAVPLAVSAWSPLPGAFVGFAAGVAGLWWLHQRGERGPVEVVAERPAAVVAEAGEPAGMAQPGEPAEIAFDMLPETEARPAMLPIAAGRFVMGSPEDEAGRYDRETQHPVTLTHDYWMAETPVTQAQYAALMGHNPSHFSGEPGDGPRPVEQVNWRDAVRYCNALSVREGLAPVYAIDGTDATAVTLDPAADGYRLPTEAEWEYAARAGTTTATYAGDLRIIGTNNAPVLDAIAWYGGNSGSTHPKAIGSAGWPEKQHPHERASTQPVKDKQPNAWGLYDMLGNVWEWVGDWHAAYPAGPAVDPAGPSRGGERVLRGGSFNDSALWVRAAYRNGWHPSSRRQLLGFRPVRPAPRAR